MHTPTIARTKIDVGAYQIPFTAFNAIKSTITPTIIRIIRLYTLSYAPARYEQSSAVHIESPERAGRSSVRWGGTEGFLVQLSPKAGTLG